MLEVRAVMLGRRLKLRTVSVRPVFTSRARPLALLATSSNLWKPNGLCMLLDIFNQTRLQVSVMSHITSTMQPNVRRIPSIKPNLNFYV